MTLSLLGKITFIISQCDGTAEGWDYNRDWVENPEKQFQYEVDNGGEYIWAAMEILDLLNIPYEETTKAYIEKHKPTWADVEKSVYPNRKIMDLIKQE